MKKAMHLGLERQSRTPGFFIFSLAQGLTK
jgi:hypothetical protein